MKELSKKQAYIIWGFISLMFGIIYEVICSKLGVYSNFGLDRIIIVTSLVLFFGAHIIFGFKKLYDFIIEKRYIIAFIALIVLTILGYTGSSIGAIASWILEPEADNTVLGTYKFIHSDEYAVEALMAANQKSTGMNVSSNLLRAIDTNNMISVHVPIKDFLCLARPYNIGYFFLNFDMAYSFAWNFRIIALILVTFEFLQVLTNNKKYISLVGTILIVFSSAIAWWYGIILDIIICGQLAVTALEYFMKSNSLGKRILWSIIFAFSLVSYIFTLYPAWIISFGYIFLAISIWIILKNAKAYNFKKTDFICILIVIGIVVLFLGRFYILSEDAIKAMLNTSYPGDRSLSGGHGIKYLFSYAYSFMLPFIQTEDNMIYASMLSFFPIPLIMGMIYIYKKEKHIKFILPMIIVLVLESIWCMTGFPEFLGKVTLLSMVPVERCAIAVALGSIYLYLYMIANIEENFISMKDTMKITLVVLVLFFCIDRPDILENSKGYMYLFAAILTMGYFLVLNSTDKKYSKLFLGFAVIWTLIGGVLVNPITKGTNIITETKLAEKIQAKSEEFPESVWITENMDMVVSNYLVANGAKTLNSTNFYPNEEFWRVILDENFDEFKYIWNRYAHIRINLTTENTSIRLDGEDKIIVNLNYDKLEELNVKYIVSYKAEEELENGEISLNKVYENKINNSINIENEQVDAIYIYEIVN